MRKRDRFKYISHFCHLSTNCGHQVAFSFVLRERDIKVKEKEGEAKIMREIMRGVKKLRKTAEDIF